MSSRGGGNARRAAGIARWLKDRQSGEMFTAAQVPPGPHVIFVALLGHFIAGAGVPWEWWRSAVRPVFLTGGNAAGAERFRKPRRRIACAAGRRR